MNIESSDWPQPTLVLFVSICANPHLSLIVQPDYFFIFLIRVHPKTDLIISRELGFGQLIKYNWGEIGLARVVQHPTEDQVSVTKNVHLPNPTRGSLQVVKHVDLADDYRFLELNSDRVFAVFNCVDDQRGDPYVLVFYGVVAAVHQIGHLSVVVFHFPQHEDSRRSS